MPLSTCLFQRASFNVHTHYSTQTQHMHQPLTVFQRASFACTLTTHPRPSTCTNLLAHAPNTYVCSLGVYAWQIRAPHHHMGISPAQTSWHMHVSTQKKFFLRHCVSLAPPCVLSSGPWTLGCASFLGVSGRPGGAVHVHACVWWGDGQMSGAAIFWWYELAAGGSLRDPQDGHRG